VSCVVWKSVGPRPPMNTTGLIITPESFMTKAFVHDTGRMKKTQTLNRIVIDECHTGFDSIGGFRPTMRKIGKRAIETQAQLVMLTATCPPSDVRWLADMMRIPESSIRSIRATTTRKNIRYGIRKCPGKKTDEIVEVV